MTIEECMRLVGKYGDAVLEGSAHPQIEAIHAALLALVAQARDDEAEECAQVCEQFDGCGPKYVKFAIRTRIAARAEGGKHE